MLENGIASRVQRLGKNIGGYFGEKIEIDAVLKDCIGTAGEHGWSVERVPCGPKLSLLALTRHPALDTGPAQKIYISTGIHGDEPAGPLAVRQLLKENLWPKEISLSILPCLNPGGFALHRRENADGLDLNRQYLEPTADETRAHIAWLERQPKFDLCLCLHEDWESEGFYVYELNPENRPSLAERIVEAIGEVCPVDSSEIIEGRAAKNGIIRPNLDPRTRPQWPESFYLLTHKTSLSYTFEAPSDFLLATRVSALVVGVRAAVQKLRTDGNR